MDGLMILSGQSSVNGIGENMKFILMPEVAKVTEAATNWNIFMGEKSGAKLGKNPLCPHGTRDFALFI